MLKLFFTAFLSISTLALAEPQLDDFAVASRAYDNGSYAEAVSYFENLVAASENSNGHLLFNLGNAYFKNQQKGAAIAAYLAASRLLPRDPDIKANLAFATKDTPDKLSADFRNGLAGRIFFWSRAFNLKEQLYTLAFLILGLGLVAGIFFALPGRPMALRIAVFGLLGFVAFWGAGCFYTLRKNPPLGAVTVAKAAVYASPSAGTTLFELREGAPFAKIGESDSWLFIQLSDGKKGWLAKDEAHSF